MSSDDFSHSALVLIGHGSTLNPDSSAPTLEHARTIREKGVFAEVICGFWKEQPSVAEVLTGVESRDVYVVPNFISEGYFTRTVIPRELGIDGPLTLRDGQTIRYCEPVGSHPRMTEVILHRAQETAPNVSPAETTLLIVGHGTSLNDNSARAAKDQVERIRSMGLYAQVEAAYMEEPPLVSDWDKMSLADNVVIVPFFIADGLHSYQDIPVLLGVESEPGLAASQSEVFRRNPYHLRNKQLFYASAIGTEPLMADVILDQVRTFSPSAAIDASA